MAVRSHTHSMPISWAYILLIPSIFSHIPSNHVYIACIMHAYFMHVQRVFCTYLSIFHAYSMYTPCVFPAYSMLHGLEGHVAESMCFASLTSLNQDPRDPRGPSATPVSVIPQSYQLPLRHIWGVHVPSHRPGICMEHAWVMHGICLEYAYEWKMHGIHIIS